MEERRVSLFRAPWLLDFALDGVSDRCNGHLRETLRNSGGLLDLIAGHTAGLSPVITILTAPGPRASDDPVTPLHWRQINKRLRVP